MELHTMTPWRPRRTVRPLTLALGALLTIAACTTGSGASAAPSSAPPIAALPATSAPTAALPATPAATPAAGSVYTVAVANAAGIGTFLTGEGGKTLYTLKSDGPDTTTCSGACATSWPPFSLATGQTVVAGSGVTAKLATFARPDGTVQVAYGGIPLYYFAGDAKAGDTNGQGLKGVWFVASPAAKAPSSSGPTY
jgi:predicted lipoprotein with Yx(FWY)xxD motif